MIRVTAAHRPIIETVSQEPFTDHPSGTSEFYKSLPTKHVGAGCLFCDGLGRVLLVEPVYKDPWEIPGGGVGADESPLAVEWIESLAPSCPNPECRTPNAKGSRQCRIGRTASEPLTEELRAAYEPYPLPSAQPWSPWSLIPDTRVADPATVAALRMIQDAK